MGLLPAYAKIQQIYNIVDDAIILVMMQRYLLVQAKVHTIDAIELISCHIYKDEYSRLVSFHDWFICDSFYL